MASNIVIVERDVEYLRILGELGAMRTDTLQKWMGYGVRPNDVLSYKNTRRRRDRWKELGLVDVKIWDQRAWVKITRKGLQWAGLPYRQRNWPFLHLISHQYATTDLAIRLQCQLREAVRDWKGDLGFKILGKKYPYYPDLMCEMRFGSDGWKPVVIEVELSRKAIDDKIRAVKLDHEILFYYVNDQTREWVLQTRERLREEGIDFAVYDLATLESCP